MDGLEEIKSRCNSLQYGNDMGYLIAEIERLHKERDAAVEDLRASGACLCCKNNGKTKLCQDCGIFASNFEWRGLQAGKGETE